MTEVDARRLWLKQFELNVFFLLITFQGHLTLVDLII